MMHDGVYDCKEGKKKEIEVILNGSNHNIIVFELGFLLGTRWDAERQLIRPKKPTIPFIDVSSSTYDHIDACHCACIQILEYS